MKSNGPFYGSDGAFIHRLSPRFLFGRYEGLGELGEELELLAARVVTS